MRILMTTDTVGGVWSFTQELISGLLKRGHSVCLASLGRRPDPVQQQWAESFDCAGEPAFEFHSLEVPLEWMCGNERSYTAAAPRLLALAGSFGADLLHSNQFCFGALPLPSLVTVHSDVFSWAGACGHEPLPDTPWLQQYRRLVENGIGQTRCIVAPTRWMLEALRANFELRQDARVIPNGRTLAQAEALAARRLQAVTAGRLWDEAKDLHSLETVTSPMPLLVAGETVFEGALSSPVPANLRFLGLLSSDRLVALFRESTVYVCTSRYEPFGLAPLEAALCGCAVLARDIASLREVWSDGALFFRNAEELTSLLSRLAADPVFLADAQQSSHHRARLYSADRMVESYLQTYAEVISPGEALEYVA